MAKKSTVDKAEGTGLKFEKTASVVVNVVVTFIETASATWATYGFSKDKIVIGATVGAGISAAWNLALKPLLKKWGWLREDV